MSDGTLFDDLTAYTHAHSLDPIHSTDILIPIFLHSHFKKESCTHESTISCLNLLSWPLKEFLATQRSILTLNIYRKPWHTNFLVLETSDIPLPDITWCNGKYFATERFSWSICVTLQIDSKTETKPWFEEDPRQTAPLFPVYSKPIPGS